MSTNKTQNYQLNQWVKSDRVLMSEFNADNAKIDAALASKASASALSSLQSVVNGKASSSSVASLSQTVSQGLGQRNCRIVTGTYTGDGTYGPDHPNTLSFQNKPLYLIVSDGMPSALHLPQGLGIAHTAWNSFSGTLSLTWSERSVSWYVSAENPIHAPTLQMNGTGTYHYIAFLEID